MGPGNPYRLPDPTDDQAAFFDLPTAVCTENLIRVDAVMESPKLSE